MKGLNKELLNKQLDEFENYKENGKTVSLDELEKFEQQIRDTDFSEEPNLEYYFRKRIARIKQQVLKEYGAKITKWDMFLGDINNLSNPNSEPLKNLVNLIDKEKAKDNISEEVVLDIENKMKSDEVVSFINTLSSFDKDRIETEISKKIRLFRNKLNRVVPVDFGIWLKQLRVSKGLSLKGLEEKCGVTASYIHRLETGARKTPTIPVVEKLAEALGVNTREFLEKLNITEQYKSNKVESLEALLALNSFTIQGKEATRSQKESIIKLIEDVIKSEWSADSKIGDSLMIMNDIESFKNTLKENIEE